MFWKVNSERLRRVSCVFERLVRATKAPTYLCYWAGLGCRRLVRSCASCFAEARVCCLRDYCGYGCGHIVGRDSYDGQSCLEYGGSAYAVANDGRRHRCRRADRAGDKAAAPVKKTLSTGFKRVISTVTVQTASFVIAKRLCTRVRRKRRSPQCAVIGVVKRVRHLAYGVPVRRVRGPVVASKRKRTQFIIVGISDAHHNRVDRGTHVSRMGRQGGRSTLRAIACMRLQRRARRQGQRKIIAVYGRRFISRHGLERQPHGINRSKRGGHGGQSTRIKCGHKPGNWFITLRRTSSKTVDTLGACTCLEPVTLETTTLKDRKKSEKGVPLALSLIHI